MSELKPCPFCGGEARLDCATDSDNVSVYCVECEDECCLVKWYDTADEAIAAWNTRVSPEREALEKIVATVTSGLEKHLFITDLADDLRICRAIATAALEVKQ